MKIEISPALTDAQKEIITRLWNAEYPEQLKYNGVEEFEEFLNRNSGHQHFLVFDENEDIQAWLVSFDRDGERWFSIIVDGSQHNKGFGTRLLNEVKTRETELNGWAVSHHDYFRTNGERYISPIGFYQKNGFTIREDIRLEKEDLYFVKIIWKKPS